MRLSEYFNNIIIDIDSDERLSLFGLIKSENLSNFEIISNTLIITIIYYKY